MTTETLITDEVRSYIGRSADPLVHEVDATGIRAFARGVGYTDPKFYDAEAARKQGYRDLVAPFGYLGAPVYNPAALPMPRPAPVTAAAFPSRTPTV